MPAQGLIDSGVEITIIGGVLFQRVAAVACLKKPDRVPRMYDHKPFALDGGMDLDLFLNQHQEDQRLHPLLMQAGL